MNATRTTPEQRRERLDALTSQLEAGIAAIQSSDQFTAYLRTAAKFHHYSVNNVLLIMQQCPDATHVAGYSTWQQLGRQVRKGECAIRILAPIIKRIDADEHADTGYPLGEGRALVGYKAACVFDIAQTDGDDLPDFATPMLPGEGRADVYDSLIAYAASVGVTVTHHDPDTDGDDRLSTYGGYYSEGRKLIFVKRSTPAHMLRVLLHEHGHLLDPLLNEASKPERETVAEAVAYMVADHFGLDTSPASFSYIALWATQDDGQDILKRVMQRTQQIAHTLIEAVEVQIAPAAHAAAA